MGGVPVSHRIERGRPGGYVPECPEDHITVARKKREAQLC